MDDETRRFEKQALKHPGVKQQLNYNIQKIVKALRYLFIELFNNVNDIPMSLRIICKYLYEFTKDKIGTD